MRRSHRSIIALTLSVLSLVVAGLSLVLSGLTLAELRRVRADLGAKRVSAQELDRFWSQQPKAEPRAEPEGGARWNGVCPKYGASSVEAFRASVQKDPVLARRFAGFRWAAARAIVLEEPQSVHVTYRQAGRIGWTRKPLTLVAGETLVTDGKTTVRGYCCNEIAVGPSAPSEFTEGPARPTERAQAAVAPTELSAGGAHPTEFTVAALPPSELVAAARSPMEITDPAIRQPPKELSSGPTPPPGHVFAYVTPYGRMYSKGGHGHEPVPEPATLVLVSTGLGLMGFIARRKTPPPPSPGG